MNILQKVVTKKIKNKNLKNHGRSTKNKINGRLLMRIGKNVWSMLRNNGNVFLRIWTASRPMLYERPCSARS